MKSEPLVQIVLRIPGPWNHPRELIERLPDGCRLTPDSLTLPSGEVLEFFVLPPDDEFAGIFAGSCRRPPSHDELSRVQTYSVNVALQGPGGSMEGARAMLKGGAAVVQAGGAGVFIDNATLAHGAGAWLDLADDAGAESLSCAFTSLLRREHELWTMGLHVIGQPEIGLPIGDIDDVEEISDVLIDVLGVVYEMTTPLDAGDIVVGREGDRLIARAAPPDEHGDDSPAHNPFGRLLLKDLQQAAEEN